MLNVVIIIPDEGYTSQIYDTGAKLYHKLCRQGFCCKIIVTGRTRDLITMQSYGVKKFLERFVEIIPVKTQLKRLLKCDIPSKNLIHENKSLNTRENAVFSLQLCHDVNVVYLLGTAEIMPRRFLTFKKALRDLSLNLKIKTVPVFYFSSPIIFLFRIFLLPGELFRIWKYKKLGHL